MARRIKGESKREKQIQPAISSLSVLHHPEHTGDSQSWVEVKEEGGDRGNLVEKKESPKRERAVKPVISLPSKNGTEDWVLKGTKLIITTKKQRLKI